MERQAAVGIGTTYLVTEPELVPNDIVGYVTLAPSQIHFSGGELRDSGLKEVQRSSFGALRIAMIGVDQEFARQGYGHILMEAAKLQAARMSEAVSMRFIVADALDTQLDWYERQGFLENNSDQERKRLAKAGERYGSHATSVRFDLGPDPRVVLAAQEY